MASVKPRPSRSWPVGLTTGSWGSSSCYQHKLKTGQ